MKHFTIILPTRNRHDTLYWTIKNCLAQNYDRMTLVVSDNCSTDQTQEVMASFKDERLRCVRTPAATSMSANIEFALQHCLDEETFVTGIGDDDGLCPGGLAYANEVLEGEPSAEVLTWCMSTYCWPNTLVESWKNKLHLSMGEGITWMNTAEMLAKLVRCDVYYHHLPGLWSSLISNSVLKRCLARSGKVIIGNIPDAASAVHIACQTSRYLYSQRSVALIGSSSHSNGMKEAVGDKAATSQFYGEATIPFNRRMIPAPSGPNYCAESLWMAHDLGLLPQGIMPDMQRVVRLMLLRPDTMTDEVYAAVTDAARRMAEINGIVFDREAFIHQNEVEKAAEHLFNDPVIADKRIMLSHRCDPRLISNIHEAANLAAELLRAHRAREILSFTEHRQALEAVKEKVEKGKERVMKLEKKLEEAQRREKKGLLARLRDKLRALRGRP